MQQLTYSEVGATRAGSEPGGPLPAGYSHVRYRTLLGRGERVFARAGAHVLTFRMHRNAGVRIESSAGRAEPGALVSSGLGVGGLRLWAPCEVVWAVDDERHAGFGYGTLPGHPATGEEAFLVTLAGDEVWFSVTAFSRAATWYARLGGPVLRVFQRAYARRMGSVLRRITLG